MGITSLDLINFIIQIVAGALGGNAVGKGVKDVNLGPLGNSIAGAIGGGLGGQILETLIPALALTADKFDIGSLIGQIAGGGISGAILTAIVAIVKAKMAGAKAA